MQPINVRPAQEATTFSSKLLNEDGEPLKIALITDNVIKNARLREVSNPIMFDRGKDPTVDGLFSTYIFGESNEEKKRLCGYIDLHGKFFHPYVFEVLTMLQRSFKFVAAGRGSWKINEAGELKEIKDESSPEYNEDNTGLAWLIENFHKIKFSGSDSMIRRERIKFITSLTDDQLFITKWLVVPIFYRDVENVNGRMSIPELNYSYNKLIQYSNSLQDDLFSFFNNEARYNIQMTLVEIRRYGQKLIEKKHGALHKIVLGKSTDRGSRDVISVAVHANYQRPEENPVDIFHTGIPLAKCLVMGYDFILRYCLNFFKDNFNEDKSTMIYVEKNGEFVPVKKADLKDQSLIYTKAFLDKKINEYLNSFGTRFDLIKLYGKDGREYPFRMTGRFGSLNKNDPSANTILSRPMTWTDLFFIAAMETCADKHVWITRFPLTDHSSTFPSRCLPLSTVYTQHAIVNGVAYDHYPSIDLNASPSEVAVKFIDTVTMSNLYLKALGGD